MQSFDFQIVLNCPLGTVFSIYVDVDRWRNRNVFGEIRWVHGTPWEEGSRLRIETLKPIRANVDQVVQHFAPKESVSYLSHVFGITCETRVIFTPVSASQTAINVVMNLVGTPSRTWVLPWPRRSRRPRRGFSRSCGKSAKLHPALRTNRNSRSCWRRILHLPTSESSPRLRVYVFTTGA
jgi:hypothetical protein